MGYRWCLPGAAWPCYVALTIGHISWLKLGFLAGWPFVQASIYFVGTLLCVGKLLFCCCFWHLWTRRIMAPGAYCKQRATLWLIQKWALWSKPFGNCGRPKWGDGAAKIAAHSGRTLGKPSALTAAKAIISQATVLYYHLKPFLCFKLWIAKYSVDLWKKLFYCTSTHTSVLSASLEPFPRSCFFRCKTVMLMHHLGPFQAVHICEKNWDVCTICWVQCTVNCKNWIQIVCLKLLQKSIRISSLHKNNMN